MKRLVGFLRQYKLFSLAVAAALIGLVLQLLNYDTAAHWVLGAVSLFAVVPLLWEMWQDVRAGTYGIDILAATAIIVSVVLHQYWAAVVIVLMLTGGKSLESYAESRARRELDGLLTLAPKNATVIRKGKPVGVSVNEVRANEKIVLKPGDIVPVDAVILEGTANFDESSLTGESLPQEKTAGDTVLSGSINVDGAVTAKAIASAEDSQYQQIIKLVRSAAASQSPFVRLSERYALPFTVMAYAVALAAWAVGGEAIRFLEVIIVATPCPLLLAAPIALISGMSRASKHGIIVKNGTALERLAEAETIAFDKTGTLTRGEPVVENVAAYGPYKKDEVLQLAASLEQSSNHVLANAVVRAASEKKLKITKAKHVREIPGRGLEAHLKGSDILVGRLSLLEEREVSIPKSYRPGGSENSVVYVAVDKTLAGVISFSDKIRPETPATLEALRHGGLRDMLVVTGDNEASARAIAQSLGIQKVHANALPADKLHLLDKVKNRPVAFVGDGVNDAPVLTSADVGIAMGARGSAAASESADIVIMTNDLSRLAAAYEIARRTFRIARQSILAGILLSLILMFAFATGKFSPLLGAVLQEVIDVVVIFNALRAHSGGVSNISGESA
jgi:heavy metal translocating P-type ATPase